MDDVSDTDIQAYIDDQLDPAGRIRVEAELARWPDLAAQVMRALQQRDEIRAFLTDAEPAPPATVVLARRVNRRLLLSAGAGQLRRLAAVVALVSIGWAAHDVAGAALGWQASANTAAPEFVEDMLESYHDQLETGTADPASWPQGLAPGPAGDDRPVPVPPPPGVTSWVGGRTLAWHGEPAVEIAYRDKDGSMLRLFATRADAPIRNLRPVLNQERDTSYWTVGPYLYAMTGASTPTRLMTVSRKAARWLDEQQDAKK